MPHVDRAALAAEMLISLDAGNPMPDGEHPVEQKEIRGAISDILSPTSSDFDKAQAAMVIDAELELNEELEDDDDLF